MTREQGALLRGILSVTARAAFPPSDLAKLVVKGRNPKKQVAAFNLCDGTRTQGEVAKALKLDSGNFSRMLARWIASGIVLKLGDARDARLLHVYPLDAATAARNGSKNGGSR